MEFTCGMRRYYFLNCCKNIHFNFSTKQKVLLDFGMNFQILMKIDVFQTRKSIYYQISSHHRKSGNHHTKSEKNFLEPRGVDLSNAPTFVIIRPLKKK